MKPIYAAILAISILMVLSVSCSRTEKAPKTSKKSLMATDSTIAAIIYNDIIRDDDVERAAAKLLNRTGMSGQVNATDSVFMAQALDWLIAQALLRHEVKRYTIEIGAEEIDQSIEAIRRQFKDESEFVAFLNHESMNREQFREKVAEDMKVQKMLELEVLKKAVDVDREAARNHYMQNSEQFIQEQQAHARHILIKVNQGADAKLVADAENKAKMILARLKKGEDFATLAKKYSDCPSAKKGGDLGFFSKGQMVKPFEDQVFSMKVGETSGLVRTTFGYHIIRLEELKEGGKIPFEKVEKNIIEYLKQQEAGTRFEKYINTLKEKADIQLRT